MKHLAGQRTARHKLTPPIVTVRHAGLSAGAGRMLRACVRLFLHPTTALALRLGLAVCAVLIALMDHWNTVGQLDEPPGPRP